MDGKGESQKDKKIEFNVAELMYDKTDRRFEAFNIYNTFTIIIIRILI